ncbi:hypothetical protein TNCV_2258581 [Trichonephila clavipes]|nr:hypothetical protein TNCV_2258581 [Trichonephila clavipes]
MRKGTGAEEPWVRRIMPEDKNEIREEGCQTGVEMETDKQGLTHVLCYEIDTGDKPPVVYRPYRYDRVKQKVIDYHVNKMLEDGVIIPIQSPYTSPVVLNHKNNGLISDSL